MALIDDRAKAKGLPVRDSMLHTTVNSLYANGEAAIAEVVATETNCGRKRNISRLRYPTVVREMQKKRRLTKNK